MPLIKKFRASLFDLPACPERAQLIELLDGAISFHFSSEAQRAVFETVQKAPWTIENNLEYLSLIPRQPLWIEFPGQVETPVSAAKAVLVFSREKGEGGRRIYMLPVWERESTVYHSRAVVTITEDAATRLGVHSRRFLSKSSEDSIERMMMAVHSYVPDNFRSELASISFQEDFKGTVDDVMLMAKRDASAEAIVTLGALLFLVSDRLSLKPCGESASQVNLKSELSRKYAFWRRRSGFHQENGNLSWTAKP